MSKPNAADAIRKMLTPEGDERPVILVRMRAGSPAMIERAIIEKETPKTYRVLIPTTTPKARAEGYRGQFYTIKKTDIDRARYPGRMFFDADEAIEHIRALAVQFIEDTKTHSDKVIAAANETLEALGEKAVR